MRVFKCAVVGHSVCSAYFEQRMFVECPVRLKCVRVTQVEAVGSWVTEGARSQGAVELRQPFTSILSHLRLHAHSQKPMNEPHSTYQVHTQTCLCFLSSNLSVILSYSFHPSFLIFHSFSHLFFLLSVFCPFLRQLTKCT